MTEKMLVQLEEKGNRISELINRFAGNEAICVKLLKKFPGDDNYDKYMSQIPVRDLASAEQSVHTLKGVASNLGLTNISDLTQKIVDEIRGEKDFEKLDNWTKELEVAYKETVDVIQAYSE